MPKDWSRLLLTRIIPALIILTLSGLILRGSTSPTPPISTTTTTTKFIYTEYNLNRMIEDIAEQEDFSNVYLLKQLAWHESRYLKYPEIVDTNGWMSRGLYHFQTSTFIEQASKYGLIPEDTTTEQGIILVQDVELQIRTVCRMGNDDMRLIRNKWWNSWNKIYMCK